MVPRQSDDALDQVLLRVVRQQANERQPVLHPGEGAGFLLRRGNQPALGVPEHNDVAALQGERLRDQEVHEDPVVHVQGVDHGFGRDVEGPEQEGLDQEGQHDGDEHHCGHFLRPEEHRAVALPGFGPARTPRRGSRMGGPARRRNLPGRRGLPRSVREVRSTGWPAKARQQRTGAPGRGSLRRSPGAGPAPADQESGVRSRASTVRSSLSSWWLRGAVLLL